MQQYNLTVSFIYNLFSKFKKESFINPQNAKNLSIMSNLSKMNQGDKKITAINQKFVLNCILELF